MPFVGSARTLRRLCVQVVSWFVFCAAYSVSVYAQVFTEVASLNGADGSGLYGPLTQGPNGNLYSAAEEGGAANCPYFGAPGCGTIFMVTRDGELTLLYTFCLESGCTDGIAPFGGLLWASNGYFYGTTRDGGGNQPICGTGCGTVFRMSSDGEFATLHGFDYYDGAGPEGPLIQATDGDFYGSTVWGVAPGTIFGMSPQGPLVSEFFLNGNNGFEPLPLIQATDGNFYTAAPDGGVDACFCGVVLKITRFGAIVTLHSFNGTDGKYPNGPLLQGFDGNLYGTTMQDGNSACGCGTVFRISTKGEFTVLHNFTGVDGFKPIGLIQATDGNLYGVTGGGGNSKCSIFKCGSVFRMTSSGQVSTLHVFPADQSVGPNSLLQATDGNFYGTTIQGGNLSCSAPYGCGTIFKIDLGLKPFVSLQSYFGRVGDTGGILGQGLKGATNVSINGTPAVFTVVSDTYLTATVPDGASSGYVSVTTQHGTLASNKQFRVIP